MNSANNDRNASAYSTVSEHYDNNISEPIYLEEKDFLEICINKLTRTSLWNYVVPKLHASKNLMDFMMFH